MRNLARVDEARAGEARARSLKAQLAQGVELETRGAFLELRSSCRRAEVAAASVGQAEEAYRIISDRYRSGLYALVALLDAEAALESARASEVAARRDFAMARSRLRLAAGVLSGDFE